MSRTGKFLSLFILPAAVVVLFLFYLKSQKNPVLLIGETGEKTLSIPYQTTDYQDFGLVYTPNAILPVKTPDSFKNFNFLIDTGAIVSAIPAKEASSLGITLAYLPRVAVQGYGGQTSFTYRGNFQLKILDDWVTLPCIFSQIDEYNYILGRKGIFDNYSIKFNSDKKAVEFTKKI